SVVMPIRNEARFVQRAVAAIQCQDYPGAIEILCVDGGSDDGTIAILASLAADDPRLRVLDHPGRTAAAAMNIGARAARHDLVLRMDAHAIADPDYIRRSVEVLQRTRADCAGGRWTICGETWA